MGRTIFITGTDTGVGKTAFTAAFLAYLRSQGKRACALKPFCSGDRSDVSLLSELQDHELPLDIVNPVYFDEPVAPLVAARKHSRKIHLGAVIEQIQSVRRKCEWLLIEGCGGVLVPLTETHTIADFIRELRCCAIVVAANRLGVINHTLLTLGALQTSGIAVLAVVLVDPARWDIATRSNLSVLADLTKPVTVLPFRRLGRSPSRARAVKNNLGKIEKALAPLLELDILSGV